MHNKNWGQLPPTEYFACTAHSRVHAYSIHELTLSVLSTGPSQVHIYYNSGKRSEGAKNKSEGRERWSNGGNVYNQTVTNPKWAKTQIVCGSGAITPLIDRGNSCQYKDMYAA